MHKDIVMFSQRRYSPFTALARDVFFRYQIPFREVNIDDDATRLDQLQLWTGRASVPTIFIAETDQLTPYEPPSSLDPDQPPKGVDRGSMISEPNNAQLENWLHGHGFLKKAYKR